MDYKTTVFLPQTDFPMRAGLAQKEPEILAFWQDIDLPTQLLAKNANKKPFILHDGPPYANGNLHIGHMINKVLKDVINRHARMQGHHVRFRHGWDCHGLPIEWKIEEKYRQEKRNKKDVDINEFRNECRAFAAHWVGVQQQQLQRVGVDGDWPNIYTTMTYANEAAIAETLLAFLMNGSLYQGFKPVLWSVVEQTALAEAEVEYHDHTSHTAYVGFPVTKAAHPALSGAKILIWTTTPWTLPANTAIACHADMTYAVIECNGQKWVIEPQLWQALSEKIGLVGEVLTTLQGKDIVGSECAHPLAPQGYDDTRRVWAADFVTAEQGTGFVHIAPAHGDDDFALYKEHGFAIKNLVEEDGRYSAATPAFAGQHIFKAHTPVLEALQAAGALVHHETIVHSYPHSWRSKAPLIYRATPQWFIALDDTNAIRSKALQEIQTVQFVPEKGRNRLQSMVAHRPDWCVSRQRAWGVPLPLFVHKATGEPLRDAAVNQRIIEAFYAEGADAWFSADAAARFLPPTYNPEDYSAVRDILDVWFDSGATYHFVLEKTGQGHSQGRPADVYLEGSDQHRGWFQSSLLHRCGLQGQAPYNTVVTAGFVLDDKGHKMSKSQGNVVDPADIIKEHGADILRLWVIGSDYFEDVRIGKDIIKQHSDVYRRLRNTLRYILGNMADWQDSEYVDDIATMPLLEQYILHRLTEINQEYQALLKTFDFNNFYNNLHHFCANDLSALYFDIRKDSLYCDAPTSLKRRSCRTVLRHLFTTITPWLAPLIPFTAEEVWQAGRKPNDAASVHVVDSPTIPIAWQQPAIVTAMESLNSLRRVINGALEIERQQKSIGSSLQAHAQVYLPEPSRFDAAVLAEMTITSSLTLHALDTAPESAFRLDEVPACAVVITKAAGEKCERCWQVLPSVGANALHPSLCHRCVEVVCAPNPKAA